MARSAPARAVEWADLVLLSLYVLIPPSRAQEIRTLEILPPGLQLTSPEVAGKNLLRLEESGRVTLTFQSYKTAKTYGPDTTTLKSDHELSRIIRDYVKNHRARLTTADSQNFLLVNNAGKPFSSPAFSSHVKHLFHRLTGVSVSLGSTLCEARSCPLPTTRGVTLTITWLTHVPIPPLPASSLPKDVKSKCFVKIWRNI